MKTDQVTEAHHARVAYVYLRQSSTQQVLHHTESQRRQRGLVQRAMALGWRSDRTVLIDEDLGQSAGRTGQRSGFERLLGEVAIGKVGFILFAGGLAYFQGESQLVPSARHLRGHPYADWRDLPGLWEAPTTRAQDKKRLIRCLVAQVVVCVPEEDAPLKADVHWVGGEVTCIQVSKGRTGGHRYVTEAEIVELVRRLAEEFSDEQIARILHRRRLKTSKGLAFNAKRVTNLRYTHQIPGHTCAVLEEDHVYTVEHAAELLGVTRGTVVRWIELGLLKASQILPGAPWRVQVSESDRHRLAAADAPTGWLPLKGAAHALGVSQQTVVEKLKRSELAGVRVRVGARTAWRIPLWRGHDLDRIYH